MKSIRVRILSILIISISSFIGLVLVELILISFKSSSAWDKTSGANILRNFYYKFNISNLYPSDSNFVVYYRDEYGLRDDCNNTNDIEILTIGGSTTDQRYVKFKSTFQKVLQEKLSKEFNTFGCVSNAGVDGHSTWGHNFAFENWFPLIPNLSPNFILFYVGLNDTHFDRKYLPNDGFDNVTRVKTFKNFLKEFEVIKKLLPIYRYVKSQFGLILAHSGHRSITYSEKDYTVSLLNENTKSLSKENAKAFKIRFEKLLEQTELMGAIPICVTQPHRYILTLDNKKYGIPNVFAGKYSGLDFDYSLREINAVMYELCGENLIDLYNHNFLGEHFYDGAHTTDLGSIYIGEIMANFFQELLKKIHL